MCRSQGRNPARRTARTLGPRPARCRPSRRQCKARPAQGTRPPAQGAPRPPRRGRRAARGPVPPSSAPCRLRPRSLPRNRRGLCAMATGVRKEMCYIRTPAARLGLAAIATPDLQPVEGCPLRGGPLPPRAKERRFGGDQRGRGALPAGPTGALRTRRACGWRRPRQARQTGFRRASRAPRGAALPPPSIKLRARFRRASRAPQWAAWAAPSRRGRDPDPP